MDRRQRKLSKLERGLLIWSLFIFCSCQIKPEIKGKIISDKPFNAVREYKIEDQLSPFESIANKAFDAIYQVHFFDSIGNVIDSEYVRFSIFNKRNKTSNQFKSEWFTVKCLNNNFIKYRESLGSFSGSAIDSVSVFIHPIRSGKFMLLELAPFPYIFFNKTYWKYDVNVGQQWQCAGIKWKNNLLLSNEYYLLGMKNILINNKNEICYEVFSTSKSKLTKSRLYFLYSNKYGFVELRYTNVDNSVITFKLIQ